MRQGKIPQVGGLVISRLGDLALSVRAAAATPLWRGRRLNDSLGKPLPVAQPLLALPRTAPALVPPPRHAVACACGQSLRHCPRPCASGTLLIISITI